MVERQIISDITKVYPHMLKIVLYRQDYVLSSVSLGRRKPSAPSESNSERSIRRTRSTISDIIASNTFDLWCTFTFNCKKCPTGCKNKPCICTPANCLRFDPGVCKLRMSAWLHRQKLKNPGFSYIIVPEFHKSGAVHFHAFIKNCSSRLTDTGKVDSGKKVYKFPGYTLGYSYVIDISSANDYEHNTIANYMQKYITKDMPEFAGKKRYFVSQNLVRPVTYVNGVSRFGLSRVIKNHPAEYQNEYYEVQHHAIHGINLQDYHDQSSLAVSVPVVPKLRKLSRLSVPSH